jgi:hypothetical protein
MLEKVNKTYLIPRDKFTCYVTKGLYINYVFRRNNQNNIYILVFLQ